MKRGRSSPVSQPNINVMLNNIKSSNTSSRKKYYRKAVSIYEEKLNKDLNGEFKIVMRDGEKLKLDHNLNLPVAQHFKMRDYRTFDYDKQLVLYETIKGKGKFKKLLDKREGKGTFVMRLNEIALDITKHIEEHIQKFIQTGDNNDLVFEKSIPLYDNDRYTLHVEMDTNAYVKVILKKLKWTFSTTTSLQHVKDKVIKYNEGLILHSVFFRLSTNPQFLSSSTIKRKNSLITNIFSTFNKYFDNQNEMVPIAFLLLSEEDGYGENEDEIHLKIEYGYTFLNSRSMGLSTILRRVLKFWAHDNNITRITSEAIAWGSQKALRSAGFSQMPPIKHKEPWFRTRLKQVPENQVFENTPKNKLRKLIYKSTKVVPKKQMHTMLLKTKPGDDLHYFFNGTYSNINGTHMFSLKKQKTLEKNFHRLQSKM